MYMYPSPPNGNKQLRYFIIYILMEPAQTGQGCQLVPTHPRNANTEDTKAFTK